MSDSSFIRKMRDHISTFGSFDLSAVFKQGRKSPTARTVFFNHSLPASCFDSKGKLRRDFVYPTNQVITARYTLLTFLPKNLFEQFKRVANVYFLIIIILQFFPKFRTVNPALAALPLAVVLLVTGIKDGYEDIERHKSDRKVNNKMVYIMSGGSWKNTNTTSRKARDFAAIAYFLYDLLFGDFTFTNKSDKLPGPTPQSAKSNRLIASLKQNVQDLRTKVEHYVDTLNRRWGLLTVPDEGTGKLVELEETNALSDEQWRAEHPHLLHLQPQDIKWRPQKWEDLKVGDFVKLRKNDGIPADLVILSTSADDGTCYVETKNLDGETNLKLRHAVRAAGHMVTARDCASRQFKVDSEAPNNNMHSWNAVLTPLSQPPNEPSGANCSSCSVPTTLNTTILRGCVLRNTEWVIGAVVTTGGDTKIVMNSGKTPAKRTRIERQMNPMVLINLALLAVLTVTCAVVNHYFEVTAHAQSAYWTFNDPDGDRTAHGLITFANGLITFQNIVPISLYITTEGVKLIQAAFIYYDNDMVYEKTQERSLARTWNVSDDLGQVEYIFSDKTGTLTQNVMQLKRCAIDGSIYGGHESRESDGRASNASTKAAVDSASSAADLGPSDQRPMQKSADYGDVTDPSCVVAEKSEVNGSKRNDESACQTTIVKERFCDPKLSQGLRDTGSAHGQMLNRFWLTLALCHDVIASKDEDGQISYSAQSPDEATLVQSAADVGYQFVGREANMLKVRTPALAEAASFELLNVLEFTSSRKRMTVVVREMSGPRVNKICVYVKGADNVIYDRLRSGQQHMMAVVQQSLEDFGNEGLRTLCLAYKELSEAEYDAWSCRYDEACAATDNRDSLIEQAHALIEQDLLLLGATAIEDKLQVGVPDAIEDLKRAGIKIWVLTGDKLETALSIGFSCNLLSKDMTLMLIRGGANEDDVYSQLYRAHEKHFGAVCEKMRRPSEELANSGPHSRPHTSTSLRRHQEDDRALGRHALIIDGEAMTQAFADPSTQALFLLLATQCQAVIGCRSSPLQKALVVKMVKKGKAAMTLAIGDGANDVSMIQAADVGVGVSGEEGLAAVNASDYSVPQFRFLKRLVLVHGHWSFIRTSAMVASFFFKNMFGVVILFVFQFYCAFSTATVYEFTYLLFWDSLWTGAVVIGLGALERDVHDRALMEVPELFAVSGKRHLFGIKTFFISILDALYQGAICILFVLYTYASTAARADGYDVALYEFSTVIAMVAIMQVNTFIGFGIHSWSWLVLLAISFGIILIWVYTAVYSALPPKFIWSMVYGNGYYLFRSALFWFSLPPVIILCMMPRMLYQYWMSTYYPQDTEIIRQILKANSHHDFVHDPHMPFARSDQEDDKASESRLQCTKLGAEDVFE